MIMNIENLMNEWFAHLPKGYAQKPYTISELQILENILESKGIESRPVIDALTEKDVDKDGKADDSADDRFIAKSQPWLMSVDAFKKYMDSTYVMPGQDVLGLEGMFAEVIALSPSVRQSIVKIIGQNTKRKLSTGSYTMGKHERTLFDIIKRTIKIPNGHFSELWFAIIHDGEIKGGVAGDTGIVSDVDVDGDGVSLKNYKRLGSVDFGSLSPDFTRTFKTMLNLGSLLTGKSITASVGRVGVNDVLSSLQDPEVIADINGLLALSRDTELKFIKRVTEKIAKMLNGADPSDIATSMCNHVDAMLTRKIKSVDWWGIIIGSKVYIESADEVLEPLLCKNNQVTTAVSNFKGLHLWVNASKIHKEIID